MQYRLELNTPSTDPNIVFHNILFDSFKINIIERHGKKIKGASKLLEVKFKVRTLDDQLIQKKDGNGRVKLKNDDFETYQSLVREFRSYEYKNKLINRSEVQQKFVYFLLQHVIANYNL